MDLEKAMEFVLQQQARFFAGLEEMRQQQKEADRRQKEANRRQEEANRRHNALQSLVEQIAQQQLDLVGHVNQFQHEVSAAVLAIAQEQKRLAAAQRHTEERLNALIAVVDGIVRKRPPRKRKP